MHEELETPGLDDALKAFVAAISVLRASLNLSNVPIEFGFATETRDSPVADVMHSPEFVRQAVAAIPQSSFKWSDSAHRRDVLIDDEGVTLLIRAAGVLRSHRSSVRSL